MKKNSIFIGIFISTFLTLTACKLDVKQEATLHRPDIALKNGAVFISGTYSSTAIEHINIYRHDIATDDIVNVGVYFPSGFNAQDKVYSFFDETAIIGKDYKYFCRVYEGKYGYYKTDESETIKVEPDYGLSQANYNNNSKLALTVGSHKLIYTQTTKVLKIDSTEDIRPVYANGSNKKYNEYCIVVQKGTTTQCFVINNDDNMADLFQNGINLQTLFPEDFFNTPLKILGILAQKKEEDSTTNKLQTIYWTPIAEIPVEDSNGVDIKDNLIVEISSGSKGNDYGL